MAGKHIAVCVDQAYGHIGPSLGMAAELVGRGHRVSYTVSNSFMDLVRGVGARPMVFEPLAYRHAFYSSAVQEDGSYEFAHLATAQDELDRLRRERLLGQFEDLYRDDKPDLIVDDSSPESAGKDLADEWHIPRIRFYPNGIYGDHFLKYFNADRLVLVPVPRFFNEASDIFDERFHFVGFTPPVEEDDGHWANPWGPRQVILISPTTGLLPQVQFCNLAIAAFANGHSPVVLSARGKHDPASSISSEALADLPGNFTWNDSTPNGRILKHASLFIGQGGPRSCLEAIWRGVPAILIPPSRLHDQPARRVEQLGLGIRLTVSEATPKRVREAAEFLIGDQGTRERLQRASELMRERNGTIQAADVIEKFMDR